MKWLFPILFFLLAAAAPAQEVPANTEQQLENLAEETIEDDALLQQLSYFQKHPLNLNTATAEELSLLRLLTAFQLQSLLSYRARFGPLLHLYELQAIPGFDLFTIQKVLPFVSVGAWQLAIEGLAARLRGGTRYALFRYGQTLERSKGYDTSLGTHYLGTPFQLQTRQIYQYKNLLYYGLVADKDAGEQLFNGAQKAGFDFYSLHFFVRDLGRVKALALGDYSLNLGQGLIQWQSMAFGKSADVMQVKRQAPVLQPYRSAGEFFFNRGAAVTLKAKRWEATAFVSYKPFSGNVDPNSGAYFTSFSSSGYHRTRPEMEDRYRLTHFSTGGALSYTNAAFKIGTNAVAHRFSLPLQKRDEPYNHFAFAGKNHFLASLDYSLTLGNAHFFGELATDSRFNRALVQGALISVDPKVDLSFFYRDISQAFQSPFGNAFTENTLPGNEKGFYAGVQLRPRNGWQIAGYADFYRSPFLKYRVSAPTRGWDYLMQIAYVPDKKTELYLRYRTENKPLDGSGQSINFPLNQQRQNVRVHFVKQINPLLTIKGRTEMVWFRREGAPDEEGFLTYLETAYAPLQRLKGNLRLQYFETGSYDSRLYAYETDVLYGYSIPGFFGKGFRYYLNLQYIAGKHLHFWLRVARTVYHDKDQIGSGLDEITGSRKTELKAQVRYQF